MNQSSISQFRKTIQTIQHSLGNKTLIWFSEYCKKVLLGGNNILFGSCVYFSKIL